MNKDLPKDSLDRVDINVSADNLSATLTVPKGAEVTAADIIERLRKMKVTRFDDANVVKAIEQSKSGDTTIEIAKGIPPVDDELEAIAYSIPFSPVSLKLITQVKAGQIIGQIIPMVAGANGTDIFGKPVERKKRSPVQIGRNLIKEIDKISCHSGGNLRLVDNVLRVEPLLEMRCEPDNVAPITFEGDASVRGSINQGRTVQITGSLSVSGAIESVQLNVGGSVIVQGGIVGNLKGKYTIGQDLRCRFVNGGFIIAGQDVQVQSNISDARIACGGKLNVTSGLLYGGVVAANNGLSCATLGHPGGVPTLIEAGQGIASRSFQTSTASQIGANQKRIQTIRAKIAPLMKIMKMLTPQQREKATELLYEADELEIATTKLMEELKTRSRSLSESARAEVIVSQMVHPGVTVRFPTVKTVFTATFKGPFTLVPQLSNGTTKIMLIDCDQTATELPTSPLEVANAAQAPHRKAA